MILFLINVNIIVLTTTYFVANSLIIVPRTIITTLLFTNEEFLIKCIYNVFKKYIKKDITYI